MRKQYFEMLPRWVLRIHGIALVFLALANTGFSYRSTIVENPGPFQFLHTNPAAEIGLWQAYLLMSIIGLVLFFGADSRSPWRFDLRGIAAHLVPLSALWVFKNLVVAAMGQHTFFLSLTIHVAFITAACIALAAGALAAHKAGSVS